MALSNRYDPDFPGKVTAAGFANLGSSGVCISTCHADGLTRSYIFPPDGGNGFRGYITSIFVMSIAATTATLTVGNEDGTVCTISTPATAGTIKGATSLANRTIDRDGTLSVILSGISGVDAECDVFVTYSVFD